MLTLRLKIAWFGRVVMLRRVELRRVELCYQCLWKKHSSGKDPLEDRLSEHQIRGWRAVVPIKSYGQGSGKRSYVLFTDTGSIALLWHRVSCSTRELANYCGLLYQRWSNPPESLRNIADGYFKVETAIRYFASSPCFCFDVETRNRKLSMTNKFKIRRKHKAPLNITMLCYAMLRYAMLCYAILWYAMLYYTIPLLYCTITILYYYYATL